jgi:hypothetical protein
MAVLDYAAYYETCFRRRSFGRHLRRAVAWTVWSLLFLASPQAARAIRDGR